MRLNAFAAILAVVILYTLPAFAGEAVTQQSNQHSNLTEKPYIYEVKSGSNVSYLLGSFHFGIGTEQLPNWVLRLHRQAEIHGYEATYDLHQLYQDYQDGFLRPDTLPSRPSNPELKQKHLQRLAQLGIPAQVAATLQTSDCLRLALSKFYDLQPFRSMDYELIIYSKRFNRPTFDLDTDQLRLDAYLATAQELAPLCDLREYMNSAQVKADRAFIDDQLKDYLNGVEPSQSSLKEDASYIYRNKAWIPKLVPILLSKRAFITIGRDHLFGREGVLELLRKNGFKVRRILSDPGVSALIPWER